jgi:hypothetical protein
VGKDVRFIYFDNAGKNKNLQQQCESANQNPNIKCEYTAMMTHKQNDLAKLRFAILASCGPPLMAHGKVPMMVRYKV